MPRLAWFSPMPPVRSGIAAYSAEVVTALRTDHHIDVYADRAQGPDVRSAHDFVWEHQQRPYDLTVYQLGNSSFHDFIWPYLFRYPGLTVLHDAHLHHARAAALLRAKRAGDYRAEFIANHPHASADTAELAIKGFDNYLYYCWPMTRLVAAASRVTAVHATLMAEDLREQVPGAIVETIRLAHGEMLSEERARNARGRVRALYRYAPGDVVFAVVGALAPEKRVPQILDAFEAIVPYAPGARLMLAGAVAAHYDLAADLARRDLAGRVTLTGYLEDEAALSDHFAACDVSLNLRWPTAREMSGPWLRALAAGRATITMDLSHMAHVPALDPRSWTVSHALASRSAAPEPVTVAIDILDEAHSLRLAMRRLARDPELRARLGAAAKAFWHREHSPLRMLGDYRQIIQRAIYQPMRRATGDPAIVWPDHLLDRRDGHLRALLEPFGPLDGTGDGRLGVNF